jgi:methyl-accepting chemotaxis protein
MARFWNACRSFLRNAANGTSYVGLAVILVIWLAAVFHLLTLKRQIYDSFRQNSANLARAFEQDVVHALREVDWRLRLLRTYYVRHDSSLDFADLIRELTRADGLAFQYVIIGPDGLMVMSSAATPGAVVNLQDREHFRVHRDSSEDRLFVSKPILGKVTGKWTIQLTRRMSNIDGSFGGVIVASVDPGHFARLYDAIDVGSQGLITLIGLDGVIRSVKGASVQTGAQSIASTGFFQAMQEQLQGSYHEAGPLDPIARIGSYLRVAGFPLVVSVGFSEQEILKGYRNELWTVLLIATGLSLLILAAIAVVTCNRAKLRATADALHTAEQIAFARNLELKARDEREAVFRRDAALRQDLQSFNEKLVGSIKTFGAMIDGLARASELLSSLASQTREHSGKVADSTRCTAENAAEVAAVTDELAASANEIAEKTLESCRIFQEAAKNTEATNAAIETLDSTVHQIDGVVVSIQKIAHQTSLLALNAAIESARAGESGKGFAVVASEVKTLANQTSRATEDIQRKINAIHEAGNASIEVLHKVRKQILAVESISAAVSGAAASHDASAINIADTIRETAKETAEVSENAKALARTAELSHDSVKGVLELARQLGAEAHRISAEADHFHNALGTRGADAIEQSAA